MQRLILAFLFSYISLFGQEITKSYYYYDQLIQLELDLNEISVVYNVENSQSLKKMDQDIKRADFTYDRDEHADDDEADGVPGRFELERFQQSLALPDQVSRHQRYHVTVAVFLLLVPAHHQL